MEHKVAMAGRDEPLDRRIGYRLKQAQSVLRGRMDQSLREVGLSVPQYATLELIRRTPGVTNAQLARDAFITRQSMNTMLQSLQRRGLIERSPAHEGGRQMPTRLTAEAEELLADAEARVTAIEAEMVAGMSAAQQAALLERLDELIEMLQAGQGAVSGAGRDVR